MPDEKSDRLVVALGKAIKAGTIKNEEAMSLAGKVNRYCKCERYLIIHIQKDMSRKDKMVKVERQSRIAMVWWLLNPMALELEGAFILDPGILHAVLYPDSAGVVNSDKKKGWWCVNVQQGSMQEGPGLESSC